MSEISWVDTEVGLRPILTLQDGSQRDVEWAPQPGSQKAFLQCPIIEALYEGSRGGGKTDTLLMDFIQHVGTGYGSEWRGVLFRRTYPELEDIIAKSKKWFGRIFPQAKYNEAKSVWTWPSGESLRFRHFSKPEDYWSYHGHAYPWIGWEELTTWPTDECFKTMFSCARSPVRGIPIKIRSTTNPYGSGHHWVKHRYRLPIHGNRVIGPIIHDSHDESGHTEPPRVAIHSHLLENRVLLSADPNYIQRISAAARNAAERKAWIEGSWDIVSGGMFDDVWDPRYNLVPDILKFIPEGWRLDRSFDWGSSKPFAVGWWAESDGSPLNFPDGTLLHTLKGDLFRVAEWYGWDGKPNRGIRMTAEEIADGIKEREERYFGSRRVRPGPADSQIFTTEDGHSIKNSMSRRGIHWIRSDKSSGSRKNGWELLRQRMQNAHPNKDGAREDVGFFVTESCDQFLRTVPTLPRDDRDLDDVDTDAEDHIGDECRYRVYRKIGTLKSQRVRGR